MNTFQKTTKKEPLTSKAFTSKSQSRKMTTLLVSLIIFTSSCMSATPLYLQEHLKKDANPTQSLRSLDSVNSSNKIPTGMAIVMRQTTSHPVMPLTEDTWPQFAAKVKSQVQDVIPLSMETVVPLNAIPHQMNSEQLGELSQNQSLGMVLIVLPSTYEVSGPARLDILPEVHLVNGQQIDNHTSVELGLMNIKTGKLVIQVQGNSFATLETLDVPLDSNRFPRILGTAMTNHIYPEEKTAVQTLRTITLNDALEQAVMNLKESWKNAGGGSVTNTVEG